MSRLTPDKLAARADRDIDRATSAKKAAESRMGSQTIKPALSRSSRGFPSDVNKS
jgi:hypothetical protein